MRDIGWLQSLGVAAGFLGVHTGARCACRLGKTSVMPSNADVGMAALNSSRVTGQMILLPTCVISSYYTQKGQSGVCVLYTDLLDLSSSFLQVLIQKEERKTEAGNLPPSSTISNSPYRPEAWRLHGGGEKRLNEQSEKYLQLPPLT